ncbi:MAG: hypothetical protein ISR91_03310, partial [Candidatus Delongbacteria bacterium]|nr:hypothetical protein [Candidatus Delongbacteria bacterium]
MEQTICFTAQSHNTETSILIMGKICQRCTACALIEHTYAEQLQLKQQRITELFTDLLQPETIIPAPQPLEYRLTAKLRVAAAPLRLGIYRPGSSEVVDLSECPVHHPLINSTIIILKQLLEHYRVSIYNLADGSGFLRGVLLRIDPRSARIGVVLVTTTRKKYHSRTWQQLLGTIANEIKPLYLVQNYNDEPGNRFLGVRELVHAGRAYHVYPFAGEEYTLPATAFSQVNGAQAARAYQLVIDAVGLSAGPV